MKIERTKERISASEMRDFAIKIYQKNGEPEYISCFIQNVSEGGMSGVLDEQLELKDGDVVSGVIEGDEFQMKIRFQGTISWIKADPKSYRFGINFTNEIMLPDVLIARIMAVA